jgi:hypothetical protein
LLPDNLKSVFSEWNAEKLLDAGIVFRESINPPVDPYADYRVIYEAWFEPAALDRAGIQFGLTDSGYIAVGIERYERILVRTGLRAIRGGFAAGHEPGATSKEGLQILFDAVTQGRVFIVVKSLFKIVTSVRFYMRESDCDRIARTGNPTYWMWVVPDDSAEDLSGVFGQTLSYRPW